MKQIVANKYLKVFSFSSSNEAMTFYRNQEASRTLTIEDTYGDNYYCCVCYHSLTREKQFVLSFASNQNEEHLSFLFWNDVFVVDTGEGVFLIDENLQIKAAFEINISLIGLYMISDNRLLILEEASFKIINREGLILENESLDLIENFSIKDDLLSIQMDGRIKDIKLR